MRTEQRARRVAGCDVERDRRVAERERLAVGGDHVAGRPGPAESIDYVPVGPGHDDARLVALLEELRAAVMVGMRVGDDGVADRRRIEPELLQPAGDLFFDGVVEERVDHDDPRRRGDRPRGVLGLADEVEVVEHFHRLGIPGRALRWPWRAAATRRPASSRPAARRSRHGAQEVEQVLIRVACRGPCHRHVRVGGVARTLTGEQRHTHQQTRRDRDGPRHRATSSPTFAPCATAGKHWAIIAASWPGASASRSPCWSAGRPAAQTRNNRLRDRPRTSRR